MSCRHDPADTASTGTAGEPTGTVDSPAPTTDPPPPPGSPVLTVTEGYGGGTYAAGAAVHVWAAVDPQRELVVGWTGDADLLETAVEWNAAGVMPDHDAALTPVVEVATPVFEPRTYTLEGRERDALVVRASPAKGAVLFFHGASYAIDQLHDNAGATITARLVRGGYTVVAVQSETEAAAGTGGWSSALDLGSNTDLRNVSALIDALHADGTVAADLPLAAWGMSSGGIFAHTVGAAGLTRAVVAYCAAGTGEANAATTAPTAWYLAANDTVFPTGATDATAFQAALTRKGVASDLVVHPQTALYDERFLRVTGVDLDTSRAIAAALRESGAVNAAGGWTTTGSQAGAGLSVPGVTGDTLTAVKAEIEIMAADHELYDDLAGRMVAFLDANL